MEPNLRIKWSEETPYRMSDQTGKHVYHVFEDDEILDHQAIKKLDRLVHGPNVDAADWGPNVTNIRKGTTTDVIHHCSDHARTASCFGQGFHQNYCPCWEYVEGAGWVRCGMVSKIMSVGCSRHREDEMRKVYDKLRKGHMVCGKELNNPNIDLTEAAADVPIDPKEVARKADEEIEETLQSGGEVAEGMYVHQRVKEQEAEQEREERYRRKDNKEVNRQRETTIQFDTPAKGEEKAGIPELDGKFKNGGRSKGGRSVRSEEQGKSNVERMAARLGITIKNKEKTKGGAKK